ncbi:CRE-JUD-4 protein, partial [Aphelenchoides avenae]
KLDQTPFREMNGRLPFLKGASDDVVAVFLEVLSDPDIPSERRRQEEIHLLAVSYLTPRQLQAFNAWSTQRRKRIRAREQQLASLTFEARDALKDLALTPGPQQQKTKALNLLPEIRRQLRAFAQRRLREQQQQNTNLEGKTGVLQYSHLEKVL